MIVNAIPLFAFADSLVSTKKKIKTTDKRNITSSVKDKKLSSHFVNGLTNNKKHPIYIIFNILSLTTKEIKVTILHWRYGIFINNTIVPVNIVR